jgi:hypothetical protein
MGPEASSLAPLPSTSAVTAMITGAIPLAPLSIANIDHAFGSVRPSNRTCWSSLIGSSTNWLRHLDGTMRPRTPRHSWS